MTPDSGSGGRWFDSSSRNFVAADMWKSSGWMRGLSRKQVSALGGLWVRVPRLPPWLLTVRDPAIPWSSGNDSWPTPRKRYRSRYRKSLFLQCFPDAICKHFNPKMPKIVARLFANRSLRKNLVFGRVVQSARTPVSHTGSHWFESSHAHFVDPSRSHSFNGCKRASSGAAIAWYRADQFLT